MKQRPTPAHGRGLDSIGPMTEAEGYRLFVLDEIRFVLFPGAFGLTTLHGDLMVGPACLWPKQEPNGA